MGRNWFELWWWLAFFGCEEMWESITFLIIYYLTTCHTIWFVLWDKMRGDELTTTILREKYSVLCVVLSIGRILWWVGGVTQLLGWINLKQKVVGWVWFWLVMCWHVVCLCGDLGCSEVGRMEIKIKITNNKLLFFILSHHFSSPSSSPMHVSHTCHDMGESYTPWG